MVKVGGRKNFSSYLLRFPPVLFSNCFFTRFPLKWNFYCSVSYLSGFDCTRATTTCSFSCLGESKTKLFFACETGNDWFFKKKIFISFLRAPTLAKQNHNNWGTRYISPLSALRGREMTISPFLPHPAGTPWVVCIWGCPPGEMGRGGGRKGLLSRCTALMNVFSSEEKEGGDSFSYSS